MKILKTILLRIAFWIINILIKEGNNDLLETKGRMVDKQDVFLTNIAFLILYAKYGITKDLILRVVSNNGVKQVQNYKLTGSEFWRPQMMQDYYLRTGKSKVKHSKHQDRLAFDINLFIDDIYRSEKQAYKELAEYWKTLNDNNVSGFDWDWDYNHFQMT